MTKTKPDVAGIIFEIVDFDDDDDGFILSLEEDTIA
jgi:hypothetical protein